MRLRRQAKRPHLSRLEYYRKGGAVGFHLSLMKNRARMIQEKAKACQRFSPFGTGSSGKARRTGHLGQTTPPAPTYNTGPPRSPLWAAGRQLSLFSRSGQQ